MRNTTFCQIITVGALTLGSFSQSLLADGPSDLEALAERARQAADDTQEAVEEAVIEEADIDEAVGEEKAAEKEEMAKEGAAAKEEKDQKKEQDQNEGKAAKEKKPAKEEKAAKEEKPAQEKEAPKKPEAVEKKDDAEDSPAVEEEGKMEKGEKDAKDAKEEKATGEVNGTGGEQPKKAVDPAERAEKLGLLGKVSNDVAAVSTFINGKRAWEELTESQMGGVVLDALKKNDIDVTDPDGMGPQIGALFQEEFLVVTGKGTPRQFGNLLALSGLSDEYQIALGVRLLTMGNEPDVDAMFRGPFSSLFEAIGENPDFLVNLVSASEMPPILLAAKVSDEALRDKVADDLDKLSLMALEFGRGEMPFLQSTEVEVAGVSFNGLSIDGKLLVETLEREMNLSEFLEGVVDPAGAQDLMKSLSEKSLVLLAGISDEGVYLYLGTDTDSIPLVDDVGKSLAASPQFEFADPYLDENLLSLFWMKKELVAVGTTEQGILKNYIRGVRLGLSDNEKLGDTEKLEGLLSEVEKLEKSYLATNQNQTAAAVSFLREDGLYSESFGGYLDGAYDYETPHQMGNGAEGTFLTIQSVTDPETGEISAKYFETAMEAFYEMASLVSDMEDVPEPLEEYLGGFQLFDTKMKGDALALWKSMNKAGSGLGAESIFEIDLEGSWPTLPDVPAKIIAEGLAPRLSYVVPVTDRAKLASSWEEMEGATAKILKTVSEMAGKEIPMQKPMSSQNDGLKTWFFAIPTMTDDFIPSITLDDEMMILGTSKERAVALAQLAEKEGSGTAGVVVEMNFAPLEKFLTNWLELVAENPEEILVKEKALNFFTENEEALRLLVTALEEFDSFSSRTWVEDGALRASSHLKTK